MLSPSSITFLKRLLDAPAPSGFETVAARVWRTEAGTFADKVTTDVAGNSFTSAVVADRRIDNTEPTGPDGLTYEQYVGRQYLQQAAAPRAASSGHGAKLGAVMAHGGAFINPAGEQDNLHDYNLDRMGINDYQGSTVDSLMQGGPVHDMMQGGLFSRYKDGGEIQGPGTGTSDSIPAVVDGQQPIAVSKGEFVVPADVVAELGPEFFHDLINKFHKPT